MIKVSQTIIEEMEARYPGITHTIMHFENAVLPICTYCGSTNTADVQIGIIGYTIYLATATSKFKLIPNEPRPGRYFCNACKQFFSVNHEDPIRT